MKHHATFLDCLHARRLVEVSYRSKKHGDAVITRTCAPWDIGPNSRAKDQSLEYYWVVDVSSPSGIHLTPISTDRLVAAVPLEDAFDPSALAARGLRLGPFYVQRDW